MNPMVCILGLEESVREDGQVFLAAGRKHHKLQLLEGDASFDHVRPELETESELERLRSAWARQPCARR